MQQYLHFISLRHGGNTLLGLPGTAKHGRNLSASPSRSPLHMISSSRIFQSSHGSLFCRMPNNRLNCIPSRKTVKAIASSSVHISASEGTERKQESTKQITRAVVSVVLVTGLVILAWSGSAIASPLVLPNLATGSVSANSGKEILVSAWMGLMAGCLHTLTGPDHLAALAPLSIGRTKLESVAVGALWGCGHDAGQVIFGILFLLLKGKLHIEVLRTWGARVVGMTLVTIGIVGIKEAQEAAVPCLAGDGNTLSSNLLPSSESRDSPRKNFNFATFVTGVVHGLQPDALLMILPALALPSRFAGAAFLIMFLFGTVLAMSGYTAFIGSCSHALKQRIPRITEHLSWISSLVAIFVGVAILASELFGISIL